jgi:hypothetical protein
MQITDLLAQTGGLQSLARELGIDDRQAAAGAAALVPAILGGLQKHEQATSGSVGGLGELLARLGGGNLMDQVLSPGPTDVAAGNAVLGQIFGSKDVSRTVADSATAQSGLSAKLLRKMLPLLAMLVTGYMAKHAAGGAAGGGGSLGGLGSILGGLLGGGQGAGGVLGGLGSMLDANGDGNALDDILRMAGKALR